LESVDIKEGLKSQGVIDAKRVTRTTAGGEKVETNTIFLTFCTATVPDKIVILSEKIPVTPFIPSPLRCFKCQKFGHGSKFCRGKEMCRDCTDEKHEGDCKKPKQCHNCKGDHSSTSKECPQWKLEQSIQKIRVTERCSFGEAKQKVMAQAAKPSFAKAASVPVVNTQSAPPALEGFITKFTKIMDMMIKKMERLEAVVSAQGKCRCHCTASADTQQTTALNTDQRESTTSSEVAVRTLEASPDGVEATTVEAVDAEMAALNPITTPLASAVKDAPVLQGTAAQKKADKADNLLLKEKWFLKEKQRSRSAKSRARSGDERPGPASGGGSRSRSREGQPGPSSRGRAALSPRPNQTNRFSPLADKEGESEMTIDQ